MILLIKLCGILIFLLLGAVALHRGDYEQAGALYKESLALHREIGDKRNLTLCLEGLAWVAGAEGQQGRSARLWGAAEALRQAIGAPLIEPFERPDHDRSVAAVRAELGEEEFAAAWEEVRKMTMEEAIGYALGKAT